ncbi:MAG: hypothetical protein LC774_01110 [Acidobacteria bacterium]|nr:hypothetical protein [Acidobacteriota bacterium]
MSVGFKASRVLTIEVTESVPSLMASSAECEWQSMMPGVTYLPVASMTRTSEPARRFAPTAAIFPLRIRMSEPVSVPCEAVRIVALRIKTSPAAPTTDAESAAEGVPDSGLVGWVRRWLPRRCCCCCGCVCADAPASDPASVVSATKSANIFLIVSTPLKAVNGDVRAVGSWLIANSLFLPVTCHGSLVTGSIPVACP